MSALPSYITQIQALETLWQHANHIDTKTVEGNVALREFIVGFIGYHPQWVKFLYRVRQVLVPLIGLKQDGIPPDVRLTPAEVPMQAGEKLAFFTVTAAQDEQYFVASASEAHLTAYLAIIREPLAAQRSRFYVVTVVKYHRWTGNVYFNVIRPFHHVVVQQMAQAGVQK
jgi:hypothetical protein